MLLTEVEINVGIMLNSFRVQFKKVISKGLFTLLVVDDFGLVVCIVERSDYTYVSEKINKLYPDWRYVFISTEDNLIEVKHELLWALMRSGYMRWLRHAFPRQVKNVLIGADNLGNLIIEKRLKTWRNKPKYKFMIDDNKSVLKNGLMRELSDNPGFFDYIPEEEQGVILDNDI